MLNNFLARIFRKAWTIFGARLKSGLFIENKVYGEVAGLDIIEERPWECDRENQDWWWRQIKLT